MSNKANKAYKVLLLGDGGVGKTAFIHRILNGKLQENYIPTFGVSVNPIVTNIGTFNIWDCAGCCYTGKNNHNQKYYCNADAAIIMYDVTKERTFNNIMIWRQQVESNCGDIPIITIGNKTDCETPAKVRRRMSEHADAIREHHVPYHDMSVKDLYNIDMAFLELGRMLLKKDIDNLSFI